LDILENACNKTTHSRMGTKDSWYLA